MQCLTGGRYPRNPGKVTETRFSELIRIVSRFNKCIGLFATVEDRGGLLPRIGFSLAMRRDTAKSAWPSELQRHGNLISSSECCTTKVPLCGILSSVL
jgi:hypothetical protein